MHFDEKVVDEDLLRVSYFHDTAYPLDVPHLICRVFDPTTENVAYSSQPLGTKELAYRDALERLVSKNALTKALDQEGID